MEEQHHRGVLARVVGPACSGFLRVEIGINPSASHGASIAIDFPIERIPSSLRLPNSTFHVAVRGGEYFVVS